MADPPDLRIPPDASAAEAAAIVAAIEQLLIAERRAAEDATGPDDPWAGRRFALAGRLAKLGGRPGRVPGGAPTDPWAAAGRTERF